MARNHQLPDGEDLSIRFRAVALCGGSPLILKGFSVCILSLDGYQGFDPILSQMVLLQSGSIQPEFRHIREECQDGKR